MDASFITGSLQINPSAGSSALPPARFLRGPDPAIQIRLNELFNTGAIQPNDVWKCRKTYIAGHAVNVVVNAHVLVCNQDDVITKQSSRVLKFDILENGQRIFLGSFTGPKGIVEALVKRTGGLQTNTAVSGSRNVWNDFEVFRNETSLGTAADVRQDYYARRLDKDEDNQPAADVAPPSQKAKLVIPAHVTPAASTAPDLSDNMNSMTLSASGQPSYLITNTGTCNLNLMASGSLAFRDMSPITTTSAPAQPSCHTTNRKIGYLHTTTSNALSLLDLPLNATPFRPGQRAHRSSSTEIGLLHSNDSNEPPTTSSRLIRHKSTKQSKPDADKQLQDTLMRELFNVMPAARQPEQFNHKHTAIHAKNYIDFLRRRIGDFYMMFQLMGVTRESLLNMVGKIDSGMDVTEAMRQGLEWSDGGPMGAVDPEEEDVEMAVN